MNATILIAICLLTGFVSRAQVLGNNTAAPTDAELRQRIVGVWTSDGLCLHGITTNTPDGTSISTQWVAGTNCNVGVTALIESVWHIEDGVMVSVVRKSSDPNITAVGREFRARIIRVDDNELAAMPLGIGIAITNIVRRLR